MDNEYRKYSSSKAYKDTKKALLEQLEQNGTQGKYYWDMVDAYMSFWVDEKLLIDDIAARGINIPYVNSRGIEDVKKNDSLDQKTKINAQMIKLLDAMGIKPIGQGGNTLGL